MKATIPDPTHLSRVLAGRVDALDQRTGALEVDVAALGRGLAHLTATLRDATRTATTPAPDQATGPGGDDTTPAPAGQRDWSATGLDAATAAGWLAELTQWLAGPGSLAGITVPECWPLHPDVVVDLLALTAAHTAAWTGADPLAPVEWLGRWAPAARDRITAATTECRSTGAHTDTTHSAWALPPDGLSPDTVAAWWTTHRDQPPETHLPLRRL